ncbi:Uncharacterized protein Adt_05665 [Abeliophyllum distichum]|uniref:CCHC-type domain-containing protein n=1 Tax=Abeliophyllum distichum TaxID=126358 RepID=A0ABD1V4Q1_9LAMI
MFLAPIALLIKARGLLLYIITAPLPSSVSTIKGYSKLGKASTGKKGGLEKSNKSNKVNKRKSYSKDNNKFKKKPRGDCCVYGKPDHFRKDCRYKKQSKTAGKVNDIDTEDIVATGSEINDVKGIPGW